MNQTNMDRLLALDDDELLEFAVREILSAPCGAQVDWQNWFSSTSPDYTYKA